MSESWLQRRKRHRDTWEQSHRWTDLADYNSEVKRGIVHTPEWDAKMAAKQLEYEAWVKQTGLIYLP